jgi:hypothetical protein
VNRWDSSWAGALRPPLVLYNLSEKENQAEMSIEKDEVKQKALERMTIKDLREMALEIPEIAGVHGMKKQELIVAIKKAKGIKDEPIKKVDASVGDLKKKIRALKTERQNALEAKDKKMATIFRRRIAQLKKKTRRIAAGNAKPASIQ